jgi:FkbM family methyltransferase
MDKKIWINGVFNILKNGDFRLINYASSLGKLIIGISSDELTKELSGNPPWHNQFERQYNLLSLKGVYEVLIYNDEKELIEFLKKIEPDSIIIGSDKTGEDIILSEFDDKVIYFDQKNISKIDVKPERGHVYHTLKNQLIDLRNFVFTNKTQGEVEREYGWEAAMYWSNIYNKELDDFFEIKPGDVFVDLGSNIGMSSTYAELKGASKIYSIEPDPNIFECLTKNSGSNWILDNVAISDHMGNLAIKLWPSDEKILVQSITFDNYIQKHNITKIDYLKIDIEGAELPVIYSISDKNWGLIDKLFIEYHEDVYNFSEETRNGLINFLLSKGFINYHVRLGGYQTLLYFWR